MSLLDTNLSAFDPVTDPDQAERYLTDWPRDARGRARAILRPRSVEEVAEIVRLSAAEGIPLVPQGGHTGLVEGAVPSPAGNEVVVSLERLNRIREVDPINFSMTVEAGCILANLQAVAAEHDRLFPLSLGAQGSCQIGGNVATNAGGINVLRYGMTRNLVLGIEAVLPDGQIWHGLRKLHKNNTGYDLKQLFIGSEGTLGIVTAVSLRLFPRPTQVETAFLAVSDPAAAVALYGQARRDLSDLLSAFEIIQHFGLELAQEATPDLRHPLETTSSHYVLMEASASGLVDLSGLMQRFLEGVMEAGHVLDGTVAANTAQARTLWRFREDLVEGQARRGRHLRTDVSVPISAISAFLAKVDAGLTAAEPSAIPVAYGHVGDGNLHYNVLPPPGMAEADKPAFLKRCETVIYGALAEFGGSISAEHGIGRAKLGSYLKGLAPAEKALSEGIKRQFDPQGLMSPGRLFER
ncbi:oxidoreductase [Labrys miyagiensis]|uniref:Oxidoreductase n=1 Tax=Labrys miyagiensis TaxID=346912 RepID=A0ABQ6CPP0_9HYPH|nr:FAD-binding oxidoreductase [Labrys miyagiensis]GLS20875.1 oxidoreductase [Labrys miyagiensis]